MSLELSIRSTLIKDQMNYDLDSQTQALARLVGKHAYLIIPIQLLKALMWDSGLTPKSVRQ